MSFDKEREPKKYGKTTEDYRDFVEDHSEVSIFYTYQGNVWFEGQPEAIDQVGVDARKKGIRVEQDCRGLLCIGLPTAVPSQAQFAMDLDDTAPNSLPAVPLATFGIITVPGRPHTRRQAR
jgi:hypothetical protein